jgi:hypothetical protein
MSPAQKKAQDNFKKAIEYRTKTKCSLKQAFAHVKGSKVKTPIVKKKVAKKDIKKVIRKKVGVIKKKAVKKELTAYDVLKFRSKVGEKKFKKLTPAQRVKGAEKKSRAHKDTKSHNVNIRVISGIFDTTIIADIDGLKKEYFKLAKKYHPDAGGTTVQFQQLQAEYEKLLKKLLSGSSLNQEQKDNEIVIDKAIRDIIDALINIEGITVEVIGKWLWIGGDTYPVRTTLKQAGLTFIKKGQIPYWVYKGVESSGRGTLSMDEIKNKYGVHKFDAPKTKKLSGIVKINRTKLKSSLERLKKGLNKRPI